MGGPGELHHRHSSALWKKLAREELSQLLGPRTQHLSLRHTIREVAEQAFSKHFWLSARRLPCCSASLTHREAVETDLISLGKRDYFLSDSLTGRQSYTELREEEVTDDLGANSPGAAYALPLLTDRLEYQGVQ